MVNRRSSSSRSPVALAFLAAACLATAADAEGGSGPAEPALAAACTATATRLCLNNDRFAIEVDWTKGNGETGVGTGVELTSDTGYFWFFNANNVEMVIKVLNACPVNSRYWVFAAGLTDVRVDITVTDTNNGAEQVYTNPQGAAFEPIQDTGAFATCP